LFFEGLGQFAPVIKDMVYTFSLFRPALAFFSLLPVTKKSGSRVSPLRFSPYEDPSRTVLIAGGEGKVGQTRFPPFRRERPGLYRLSPGEF